MEDIEFLNVPSVFILIGYQMKLYIYTYVLDISRIKIYNLTCDTQENANLKT